MIDMSQYLQEGWPETPQLVEFPWVEEGTSQEVEDYWWGKYEPIEDEI